MTTRGTIAVDMDDVLFLLVPSLTSYVNSRFGSNFRLDDYTTYDFREVWGVSSAESLDIVAMHLRSYSLDIAPLAGSTEAIARLAKEFALVVVTSRPEASRLRTEGWLRRHFPRTFADLIMTGNRYEHAHWQSKGGACAIAGADLLIDDQLEHVISANSHDISAILFGSYPWQKRVADTARRASGWRDVPGTLASFETT